jgi:hypothetical protein
MDLMTQFNTLDLKTPALRRTIELHIDELVLSGFGVQNGDRIGAALERELSRLISSGDLVHLAASPLQVASLNAGAIRLEPNAHPNYIGRELARRVYGQLARVQHPGGIAHNTAEGAAPSHA